MNTRKRLYSICSAIVVTLAMLVNYRNAASVPESMQYDPAFIKTMYLFWESIRGDGMIQAVVFAAVAAAIYKSYEKVRENKTVLIQILSFLLAVMMAVGKSMSAKNSLDLMYHDMAQVIKTVVMISGYYFFYLHACIILYSYLHKEEEKSHAIGEKFFADQFYRKPFLVISIIWLPQILLKYPGALCWDTYAELYQYFGLERFTSHHPPLDTWLMGTFVNFGKMVGSMNVGLFLYIFVQTVCFIAVMAYTFTLLERLKVKPIYRLIILCIYCIVPYYIGYAGVMIKDTIYGIAFLWYFLCLVSLVCDQYAFCYNKRNIVRMIASATLVALSRKNGIYVVVPMAIVLVLYFGKMYWKEKRKVLSLAAILILPIILNFTIGGILNAHYKIAPGSKAEALSIPFQQTARYVKEYGNEVTEDEREAIDAVLDYNKIGEIYDPIISDPVKATYKNEATKEQLKRYFKVWFTQFTKHPLVYIEATLNSNYGIVCPEIDNYVYYTDALGAAEWFPEIKLSVPGPLKQIQDGMGSWYKVLHEMPVVALFSNVAFYVVIFLYIIVFMLKDKKYSCLILTVPGLLSIAITVASPVFLGHPRYMFPVVYTVPIFFALYTAKIREK